ncbi:DsbA family protein [Staphylococcus canis]|uniref:Thioredoxin domain-containing protein n=1 Tax=Staphylococcus canis TaxID=2724942 RepID=A0ABS0T8D0_9STAP|nr:thioredoxin domain-containing protein [Staphylococcus canis]MBI5974971.1 thioredoxin domain-containing protein [Staphylococcus canis]
MKNKKWIIILIAVLIAVAAYFIFASTQNSKFKPLDAQKLRHETQNQPLQGKSNGRVLIVEFGDFKCPYCGQFEREIKPKLEREFLDNDQIELRYVNVLLHGQESERGARAAHAVNMIAPKQYWTFHQQLFKAQPKKMDDVGQKEWLTEDLVDRLIRQLDITQAQKSEIIAAYKNDHGEAAKRAKADHKLAKSNDVPQVPALYVDGKPVEDVTNYQNVKDAINQALKK